MPQPLPYFWYSDKLMKYVKLAYEHLVNHFITLTIVPVTLGLLVKAVILHGPGELLRLSPCQHLHFDDGSVQVSLCSAFLVTIVATAYYFMCRRRRAIFLIDFACWKPPFTCRIPFASFMEHSKLVLKENPKSYEFQTRMLERSGLGEETCLPPAIHYIPPEPNMAASRDESEEWEALKENIPTIGPLVLPASEQLLFLINLIGRKIKKESFGIGLVNKEGWRAILISAVALQKQTSVSIPFTVITLDLYHVSPSIVLFR
ncbi:hypothetical protein SAY87_015989 [Trapa incisa]|uniref:FAE domain-containing protein n=1 Tax=Trapa incisa TaxID=236973 RepID=A0AAN7QYL2_9MYRT|nr:hypothetical protein SAY87_015989 [Trapa incisa]